MLNKALVLFSGGLDSLLAVKILEKQGYNVTAVVFESLFFNADKAKESAVKNNIKLEIVDISDDHLEIVKNPKHGRGNGMNPCIDCHALMIRKASKIKGYDIIATGEVLGQRPMSQNKRALELIERKTGVDIVRPLSDGKYYSISGRQRKEQIELAKEYGIIDYPEPGGGCVLTEKEFSEKLKNVLKFKDHLTKNDAILLKIGRHLFVDGIEYITSRNKEEGIILKKLREDGDIIIEPSNFSGALVFIRIYNGEEDIEFGKSLIKKYSTKAKDKLEFNIIR